MRTLFAYLPIIGKGFLCLSQNRFAKFRGDLELIYPLIPASGVTQWKEAGHDAHYIDSIHDSLSVEGFLDRLEKIKPELLVFETKTPAVKQNWGVVDTIKERFPDLMVAAVGDHVSVLPKETLDNSKTDYVLTGGDFDVSMRKLADHLDGKGELPAGAWYKGKGGKGKVKNTGAYELLENLDELPFIDRELVPWQDYHESWRLHKRFLYMMGSRGCPYKCTFCSWPQMLYGNRLRFRSPEKIVDEMEMLKKKYRAQELFFDDDTFTANKKWVMGICSEIERRGLDIVWNCNGRVDNVDKEMMGTMKKSGCRLIKFGIESASQETLDRIKKGYTLEQVKKGFKISKEAGILRHGTVMLGYPWEKLKDLRATIEFVKELDVDTVQFSIPIVYPGTELYEDALKNSWLRYEPGAWEKYDMSSPSLVNPNVESGEIMGMCESAWREVYFRPKFVLNKLVNIRSVAELRWILRGTKAVVRGHISALREKRGGEGNATQKGLMNKESGKSK